MVFAEAVGQTNREVIRYGDDPSQYVELTVPAGSPRGVVVVIHGGFWKAAYDLSLGTAARRRPGRRRGGPRSTSSIGAWGSAAAWRGTLDDVRAAIGTLDGRGLDLTRVVTLGHSAGGHLAAWAGARSARSRT